MKRNFVAIMLIALFFSMSFTGCEKENVNPKSKSVSELAPELQELYKQMPDRNYGGISVIGDGILRFESIQQYEQTCEQLKRDCEMWDNLFYSQYGTLSEKGIFDIEDSLHYNEFLPIELFETELRVFGKQLFDQQIVAKQVWVDNEFKDENPTDDIFIFEWEQALYNQYREVCIEDTLYQFRLDAIVKVPTEFIRDWMQIREISTNELQSVEFVILDDTGDTKSEQEMVFFKCKDDDNHLNSSTHPNLFESGIHSFWKVVGHKGLFNNSRMDCKLENYAFHKYRNNRPVYKKCWRNCSIAVTHVIFFKQHLKGWFFPEVIATDELEYYGLLPAEQNQKTATHTVNRSVPESGSTIYLTSHYKLGVFQGPTMKWSIDGHEEPVTLQMQSNH